MSTDCFVCGVRHADNIVDVDDKPHPPKRKRITKTELLQIIAAMQRDWVQLNAFLNATAAYREWCSEYEERLAHYNRYLEVLKLEGREHRWVGTHSDGNLLSDAQLERLRIPLQQNNDPYHTVRFD